MNPKQTTTPQDIDLASEMLRATMTKQDYEMLMWRREHIQKLALECGLPV